jgi:flagellar hook-length control protein FliK
MMTSQGRTEVRVQLRPPELGAVRVELVSDQNNMVEARIFTERDDVRQMIQRNLSELRESLTASGVEVGDFDVSAQNSGNTAFEETSGDGTSNDDFSWDGAEPEEDAEGVSSGSVRGVNRSQSDDAIDYVI